MGVDEVSYRKQHHYLTLITNHDTGTIVWAEEGKNAATLTRFLDELGADRCGTTTARNVVPAVTRRSTLSMS
ncbi:MAG: transposase [Euzebya sp.]